MKQEKKITIKEYQEYAVKLREPLIYLRQNSEKIRKELSEFEYIELKRIYYKFKKGVERKLSEIRKQNDIEIRRRFKLKDLILEPGEKRDKSEIGKILEENETELFSSDEYEDGYCFDLEDWTQYLYEIERSNSRKEAFEKLLHEPFKEAHYERDLIRDERDFFGSMCGGNWRKIHFEAMEIMSETGKGSEHLQEIKNIYKTLVKQKKYSEEVNKYLSSRKRKPKGKKSDKELLVDAIYKDYERKKDILETLHVMCKAIRNKTSL